MVAKLTIIFHSYAIAGDKVFNIFCKFALVKRKDMTVEEKLAGEESTLLIPGTRNISGIHILPPSIHCRLTR